MAVARPVTYQNAFLLLYPAHKMAPASIIGIIDSGPDPTNQDTAGIISFSNSHAAIWGAGRCFQAVSAITVRQGCRSQSLRRIIPSHW